MATVTSEPIRVAAPGPAVEYRARLYARTATAGRMGRINQRIVLGRRLMLGAVIGYVVFDPTEAQALVPLAFALVPLLFLQNAVLKRWRRARKGAHYYAAGLARLEDRWIGHGDQGRRYLTEEHLYAEDLDIFGHGSLFELLSTAQTPMGQDTLAGWLSSAADLPVLRARQQSVRDLVGAIELREALAALDADLGRVAPAELIAWADAPRIFASLPARILGVILAWGLTITSVGAMVVGGTWWTALLLLAALEAGFYLAHRHDARAVARHVADTGYTLGVLYRLSSAISACAAPPAAAMALRRRVDRTLTLPARFFTEMYGLFLQNSFLHALKIQGMPLWEAWRLQAQPAVRDALAAAGELEALSAISAYAYEHPLDPFPELVETGPVFAGQGLAHPLMPTGSCVSNDLSLDKSRRLILISGSNMSGKSTLLRTVGINTVLALAGAPVRAAQMTISPVTLGTAMRFRDSIHHGASYFYAVLTRLRAVMDQAKQERPLLFLFDEILQGTNSQDRLTGAEAVIHKLLDAGAMGLMTTHDLALTTIVADLAPRAENMHCEDQLVDGRMTFDYKLRPGVVTKSNALALMRSMGLDV